MKTINILDRELSTKVEKFNDECAKTQPDFNYTAYAVAYHACDSASAKIEHALEQEHTYKQEQRDSEWNAAYKAEKLLTQQGGF